MPTPMAMPSWANTSDVVPIDVDLLDTSGQRQFASQFASRIPKNEGLLFNDNANLAPTYDDSWRDIASSHDYRMPNGLGISRSFARPDSQLRTEWFGEVQPTKNFGRDSKTVDQVDLYASNRERADMQFRILGSKPHRKPAGTDLREYEYNVPVGYGGDERGGNTGVNHSNYNRLTPVPDADAVYRRLYQPAPSRLTKMLGADTELLGLMPQRTVMDPVSVVDNDMTRHQIRAVPRNVDVREAVRVGSAEGDAPRGMSYPNGGSAVHIWSSTEGSRVPIGSDDTGDKSVFGALQAPNYAGEQSFREGSDRLTAAKMADRFVLGHDIEDELALQAREQDRNGAISNPFGI